MQQLSAAEAEAAARAERLAEENDSLTAELERSQEVCREMLAARRAARDALSEMSAQVGLGVRCACEDSREDWWEECAVGRARSDQELLAEDILFIGFSLHGHRCVACSHTACVQNARLLAAYVGQKQETAQLKEELCRQHRESEVRAPVAFGCLLAWPGCCRLFCPHINRALVRF